MCVPCVRIEAGLNQHARLTRRHLAVGDPGGNWQHWLLSRLKFIRLLVTTDLLDVFHHGYALTNGCMCTYVRTLKNFIATYFSWDSNRRSCSNSTSDSIISCSGWLKGSSHFWFLECSGGKSSIAQWSTSVHALINFSQNLLDYLHKCLRI